VLPLPFQNVCSGFDFGADVVGFDFMLVSTVLWMVVSF
jgi:hypothetical protein